MIMIDRDLRLQAEKGIAERVAFHTVVVDVSLSDKRFSWGTGSLIVVGSRFFILSAKHVIDDRYCKNNNIRILFRPEKALEHATKKEIKNISLHRLFYSVSKSYSQEVSIVNRFYSDDSDDLVLLELDPSCGNIKAQEFYDISRRGIRAPDFDEPLFLMGFSEELRKPVTKYESGVFPYMLGSKLSAASKDYIDFEPQRHFLIDYKRVEGSVDPRGFSGCGVWTRLPSGKGKVWSPNIYLVGIQTGILEESQLLKATKASRVLELMRSNSV